MSEDVTTIDNLEDALAALDKVRKADAAKRKRIDALEEQIGATDGKLAALTAYEALGTPDDLKARLTSGDAALKALTDNGVTLEELPKVAKEAKEAVDLKRDRDLVLAAQATGKPKDALAEILEGKTLTAQKGKAEDGTEVDVWGIGEGDTFKPLSELKAVQYLASEPGTPQPQPKPLPLGGAGGKPSPADPVAALNARLFGGKKEKQA